MQCCWNVASFKGREDYQESDTPVHYSSWNPAHLPSTVEKKRLSNRLFCLFWSVGYVVWFFWGGRVVVFQKNLLMCIDFNLEFWKIHRSNQNKIHFKCVIPKTDSNQLLVPSSPLYEGDVQGEKKKSIFFNKQMLCCGQIILLGIKKGHVVFLAHSEHKVDCHSTHKRFPQASAILPNTPHTKVHCYTKAGRLKTGFLRQSTHNFYLFVQKTCWATA